MLFSVLIANYNNSLYLSQAILSVQRQTYQNWEIIIVDDASKDNFNEVVSHLKYDSRIKIYQNEINMGCGYTKNRCAGLSSGNISAFLDPDDALTTDAIQIMVDAHRNNPTSSLIHSTHYICNRDLKPSMISDYTRSLPAGIPYLLLSDGSVHHFASFKRDLYLTTVGLSPKNKKAVDQDLYYKMEETGTFTFIDKPLYYYRIHEKGISTSGNEKEATFSHYQIIEESCQRRIKSLHSGNTENKQVWIRKYRTRFYKIKILKSFRQKKWLSLLAALCVFPFIGGMTNIKCYCKKLPKEGLGLLRKTFFYDRSIHA